MLTYLPITLIEDNCVIFLDHDIVRVFDNIPNGSNSVSFTDYYITNHYTNISGVFSDDLQQTCLAHDNFTTNVFYRYDLDNILVSFTCIFLVSIMLIYFALKCFFRGLFK